MKQYYEEKRIRPDILTAAVYYSVIIIMIYGIIGLRIYGDKGAGFAAGPICVFGILYLGLVLAVQKSVWLMVRIRARRSQFLNAETNMIRSFRIFIFTGLLVMAVLLIGSYYFSSFLFGSSRGIFQCIIVAVCALFLSIQGVVRGYLQGIGYTKPIIISDLLIAITSAVSGTILSTILFAYGLKVNNLFHISEFSAVYGSAGTLAGMLIGSVAGLIQIVISFYLRKNEISEIVKEGAPRYLDNKNDVLSSIREILILYISPALMALIDQVVFIIYQKKASADVDITMLIGTYNGRVLTVLTIVTLLCCVPFIRNWNRIMARVERDELEGARERLLRLHFVSSLMIIAGFVFLFVMAGTIEGAVFGKNSDISGRLLKMGSIMVILGSIAVFYSWLLNHMGKVILTLVNLLISWVSHIALLILSLFVFKMGLYGIMAATIISFLLYDGLSIFMVNKMLRFRVNIMKTYIVPLICAAFSGLVAFLLNLIFVNMIGEVLTLLICLFVFYVVYMLLLIVLKRIEAKELKKAPLGKVFYKVATSFNRGYYEE